MGKAINLTDRSARRADQKRAALVVLTSRAVDPPRAASSEGTHLEDVTNPSLVETTGTATRREVMVVSKTNRLLGSSFMDQAIAKATSVEGTCEYVAPTAHEYSANVDSSESEDVLARWFRVVRFATPGATLGLLCGHDLLIRGWF